MINEGIDEMKFSVRSALYLSGTSAVTAGAWANEGFGPAMLSLGAILFFGLFWHEITEAMS